MAGLNSRSHRVLRLISITLARNTTGSAGRPSRQAKGRSVAEPPSRIALITVHPEKHQGFGIVSPGRTHQNPRDLTMRAQDAITERGSSSRSGLTAPPSPKENFGRPARRLLLRLVEPRSVNGRFDAF